MSSGAAAAVSSADADRAAWAADMRRRFSPAGMVNADGSVNQGFFKPKSVLLVTEARWGAEETDALMCGLERHGIGRWGDIGAELLPRWSDHQIRVRAAKLLGSQSLARYVGWRGNRAAVEAEYAKNRAIGVATGCWKHGMLVENDDGSVRRYLETQAQEQQQQACCAGVDSAAAAPAAARGTAA